MKIKVKHIPEITKIINSESTRIEKDCKILALVKGIELKEVESWKFFKLNYYRNQIKFLYAKDNVYRLNKYIIYKWRVYRLINDVEYFTTNRALSIKAYLKDMEGNFSKLCALVYKPLFSEGIDSDGNESDLSYTVTSRMEKDFSEMSYTKVAGAVFFLSKVSQTLSEASNWIIKDLEMTTTTEMKIPIQ